MTEARSATQAGELARALHPVTVEEWLERWFEREPLVLTGRDEDRNAGLLSLADVEFLAFSSSAPEKRSWFQLVKAGRTLPVAAPLVDDQGELRPGQVVASYAAGFSLVLNQLERRWPPVGRFCRDVGAVLAGAGVRLQADPMANAYLTPAGTQAFSPHFDHQDVLVLQLAGAKRWAIWERHTVDPIEPLGRIPASRLGARLHEVHLRPGDLLSIPRGFPHAAAAVDHPSLHLTVGWTTWSWLDVAERVLRAVPELRATLPPGPSRADLRARVTAALDAVDDDALARLLDEIEATGLERRAPQASDHFDQVDGAGSLSPASLVARRHPEPGHLRRDGDELVLTWVGRSQRFEPGTLAALEVLNGDGPVPVGGLPGLASDEERVELARSLVQQGFLRVLASG